MQRGCGRMFVRSVLDFSAPTLSYARNPSAAAAAAAAASSSVELRRFSGSARKGRDAVRAASMSRRGAVRGISNLNGGAEEEEEVTPVFVDGEAMARARKLKTYYECITCGAIEITWWGYCKRCKGINTFKKQSPVQVSFGGGGGAAALADRMQSMFQEKASSSSSSGGEFKTSMTQSIDHHKKDQDGGYIFTRSLSWLHPNACMEGPRRLSDILRDMSDSPQRLTLSGGIGSEFSGVLGGGIVPGSLILLGGDPGIGKSTLLLQVANLLAEKSEFDTVGAVCPVLYVSSEESLEQISARADRLKLSCCELYLYSQIDLEAVFDEINRLSPCAVIIDSIQAAHLSGVAGGAGSANQVRECANFLLRIAKMQHICIFLIGHVTKTGNIAGPRVLEHMVDVVLYMEGDKSTAHRILRVVKNRYGSTNEIGVFEMVEGGLEALSNPSRLFFSERIDGCQLSVSAFAVIMNGSRPFLVEIQALYSRHAHCPRHPVDAQRLSLIFTVLRNLSKSYGVKIPLNLNPQDVFTNVVGGMKIEEPAADLAIAIAILSSCLRKVVSDDIVFVGEIGLSGELRPVRNLERRIMECLKLGFKRCIIPKTGIKSVMDLKIVGIEIIPCSNILDILSKKVVFTTYD